MDETNLIVVQITRMADKQEEMSATLLRNTISLEEHIKRTELLEQQIVPLKRHVDLMNAMAKIASFVAAGLFALIKLVHG